MHISLSFKGQESPKHLTILFIFVLFLTTAASLVFLFYLHKPLSLPEDEAIKG